MLLGLRTLHTFYYLTAQSKYTFEAEYLIILKQSSSFLLWSIYYLFILHYKKVGDSLSCLNCLFVTTKNVEGQFLDTCFIT